MQSLKPTTSSSLTGPPGHSVCCLLRPLQPFGIQELPKHDGKKKSWLSAPSSCCPQVWKRPKGLKRGQSALCALSWVGSGVPRPPQAPGTQWDSHGECRLERFLPRLWTMTDRANPLALSCQLGAGMILALSTGILTSIPIAPDHRDASS